MHRAVERSSIYKTFPARTSSACGPSGLELSKTINVKDRWVGDSTTRLNRGWAIQDIMVQAKCLTITQSLMGTHGRALSRGVL